MKPEEFKTLIQAVVFEASKLRDARTTENDAPVNYACVFAQNEEEYESLLQAAQKFGQMVKETEMGPVFHIQPLTTSAGSLRIIKVRKPDSKRPERGDADFTLTDYESFKRAHLDQQGFRLIARPEMEMIELADPAFNVLVYFSNPPLGKVLNLDF